jgi:hypothetical protein
MTGKAIQNVVTWTETVCDRGVILQHFLSDVSVVLLC